MLFFVFIFSESKKAIAPRKKLQKKSTRKEKSFQCKNCPKVYLVFIFEKNTVFTIINVVTK